MNCEKAEKYLSAYLDDMLDPQLREEIAAHLESCALCSEVVAEYRRFDMLLRDTPRISPPPELRDRIFGSRRFAAILQQQAKASETLANVPSSRPHQSPSRGSPPRWSRIALQSAAVLVIIIGSALLLKQGFFHSSPTTTNRTTTPVIGNINPNSVPLAAGSRVIYEHNGALWSAPEDGPGIGEQLTPTNVTVSNVWSVSPDGSLVAYVEAGSGRIHVIRSDRQNDVAFSSFSAICTNAASCGVHPVLSWSPDGKQIAYQALDGSLHLVNVDGTDDQTIVTNEHGFATSLLWSSDGLRLAFVEVNDSVESIWSYDLATNAASQVAASADPADSNASVQQMFWLEGNSQPTLTWTAWDASTGSLTGIFSCDLVQNLAVERLTPSTVELTAAGFTDDNNGEWLVGFTDQNGNPQIATVAGSHSGLVIASPPPDNSITGIYWSPLGDTVALVDSTGEMYLAIAIDDGASLQAPEQVLSDVTGTPVWSPDGTHLATPLAPDGTPLDTPLATPLSVDIISLNIIQGTPTGIYHLLPAVSTVTTATMVWSPDSQEIAITSPTGTYLTSYNGKIIKQVDTQTASGPFAWSYSG